MNQISTQIGYIVVNNNEEIYVGSQDRFNKCPQVFKVYRTAGRAESSAPIWEVKYRNHYRSQDHNEIQKYNLRSVIYKIIEVPQTESDKQKLELQKKLLDNLDNLDLEALRKLVESIK